MAVKGSNTFQWEPCVKVQVIGDKVIHTPATRIRTANTVISVLGVSLSVFGNWEWSDDTPVYRLPDGTECDAEGNPV